MRNLMIIVISALMALGIMHPTTALAQSESTVEVEVLGLVAHPSDVDIGNANIWQEINVDPFRGDVDQASLVLSPKTSLRPFEYHEAFAMRTRGECHRYFFGPKDVFRTTFGRDRSMLAKPAFNGWADVCIVRADNSAVVFPDDCTNIGPAMAILRITERETVTPQPAPAPVGITFTQTMSNSPMPTVSGGVGGVFISGGVVSGDTNINVTSASSSSSASAASASAAASASSAAASAAGND